MGAKKSGQKRIEQSLWLQKQYNKHPKISEIQLMYDQCGKNMEKLSKEIGCSSNAIRKHIKTYYKGQKLL